MQLEHSGARPGRRDHVIIRRERLDHLLGDLARRPAVAGVVRGLPATGLARHFDPAAGVFQQLCGGETDRRTHQIDQAGDEQPDPPALRVRSRRCARGCFPLGHASLPRAARRRLFVRA